MRVTASVAMLPAAPGRTSTTNCWPSFSDRNWAIRRAIMSEALPAAWPTMIFTGRAGYACALAMRDTTGSAAAPAARCRNLRRESFILNLPLASDHSITSSARPSSGSATVAECLGGLEVQEHLHFRHLLHRQFAGPFAFENAAGVVADPAL